MLLVLAGLEQRRFPARRIAGLPACGPSVFSCASGCRAFCRLELGDTAGWKPALLRLRLRRAAASTLPTVIARGQARFSAKKLREMAGIGVAHLQDHPRCSSRSACTPHSTRPVCITRTTAPIRFARVLKAGCRKKARAKYPASCWRTAKIARQYRG